MIKIYIDHEFRIHLTNPDGIFRKFEIRGFDDKCTAYIEGHRYIPLGESWEREDGHIFNGEMISPWKPYSELDAAQREYEQAMLAEQKETIAELDALVLNLQYNNLISE